MCTRQKLLRRRRARSPGRRYFPRFYRGNLSRRRHSEPRTKREGEKKAGEDTLLGRRPIITSSCTNVAMPRRYRGKRKRASRRRLFIRSSRFIFPHDAMHYTSPRYPRVLPALANPSPSDTDGRVLFLFYVLDRALHRKMREAGRPFTVELPALSTAIPARRCQPSANPLSPPTPRLL